LTLLAAEFERRTGHRVEFTFQLVSEIQRKLTAGEKADLILLPAPLMDVVGKTLPLRDEGRRVIARVGIGVIVRRAAVPPDISSEAAVRQALLGARSIVLDNPSTPNGQYLARMLTRLGVADEVAPKVITKAPIEGGADLIAKGAADLGLFLASEVRTVDDTTMIGTLPGDLNNFVVFRSAIPAYNLAPEPAIAFVEFISGPAARKHWTAGGFELLSR
jgi:molybdate transport system substrate-binding protein